MWNLEALDYEQLVELRDAVGRRLLRLRRTTGLRLPELLELLEDLKLTLRDQGKEWRSLERWQWMDGEVRFWLNPVDQSRYAMGWYSIDELIQWAHDLGPVLVAAEQEREDEEAAVGAWAGLRELDLVA